MKIGEFMTLFEMIVVDVILLIFPLLIYLFYVAYSQNTSKVHNSFCLDFAFLTAVYFVIRYGLKSFDINFSIIMNIPLIIAYLRGRKFSILFLSIISIVYSTTMAEYHLFPLICEYLLYYLIYILHDRKDLENFTWKFLLIKTAFVFVNLFSIVNYNINIVFKTILILLVFYLLTYLVLFLFKKGEEIIKLHMNIKEFENDKQVRESLLKITHEIKNPIAVCKSYLDMYDSNKKEHKKYIPIIKEEINKILFLLQDFLSMTKIKIEADILDVSMLLEEVSDHFEPILASKNIEFDIDLPDDEIFVNGDYNRLNQVFTNIVKNSIEAIEGVGKIKIYTKTDSKTINIFFEDSGIGISKENLQKISEPFWTTKENGTGLGVALSCEIVKAHEGNIKYISTEGKGTLVTVTLPLDMSIN